MLLDLSVELLQEIGDQVRELHWIMCRVQTMLVARQAGPHESPTNMQERWRCN
jgi:hypothetical protein